MDIALERFADSGELDRSNALGKVKEYVPLLDDRESLPTQGPGIYPDAQVLGWSASSV